MLDICITWGRWWLMSAQSIEKTNERLWEATVLKIKHRFSLSVWWGASSAMSGAQTARGYVCNLQAGNKAPAGLHDENKWQWGCFPMKQIFRSTPQSWVCGPKVKWRMKLLFPTKCLSFNNYTRRIILSTWWLRAFLQSEVHHWTLIKAGWSNQFMILLPPEGINIKSSGCI